MASSLSMAGVAGTLLSRNSSSTDFGLNLPEIRASEPSRRRYCTSVSTAASIPAPDLTARMQRYAAAGYSRARMLAQLVSDGVPASDLAAHFPGLPPSAFEKVVTPGPRAITPRLPV